MKRSIIAAAMEYDRARAQHEQLLKLPERWQGGVAFIRSRMEVSYRRGVFIATRNGEPFDEGGAS